MMAAAAASLSRSREVAGVRSIKGLFFIFTLLCLVCVASSLTDEDQLESMKAKLHKHQQMLNSLKEESQLELAPSLELLDESKNILDSLVALAGKTSRVLPDFPPVEGFLQIIQGFLENLKSSSDIRRNKVDAEIEDQEQELAKIYKLIRSLEERRAEL